jgi:hypothetical protein
MERLNRPLGSQPPRTGGNMKSKALTCIVAMTLFGVLAIPIRLAAQEQEEKTEKKASTIITNS